MKLAMAILFFSVFLRESGHFHGRKILVLRYRVWVAIPHHADTGVAPKRMDAAAPGGRPGGGSMTMSGYL
jgi:hypothetical protein